MPLHRFIIVRSLIFKPHILMCSRFLHTQSGCRLIHVIHEYLMMNFLLHGTIPYIRVYTVSPKTRFFALPIWTNNSEYSDGTNVMFTKPIRVSECVYVCVSVQIIYNNYICTHAWWIWIAFDSYFSRTRRLVLLNQTNTECLREQIDTILAVNI